MDEPTAALTRHEADNLLNLLRRIKNQGVTVLFVSHKIEEVLAIADRVSVLRDGCLIGTRAISGLTKTEIVQMMIGREARTLDLGRLAIDDRRVALEARHISQIGRFRDVSFVLYQGEILGFYGLVGSGRTELAQILIGEVRNNGENGAPVRGYDEVSQEIGQYLA